MVAFTATVKPYAVSRNYGANQNVIVYYQVTVPFSWHQSDMSHAGYNPPLMYHVVWDHEPLNLVFSDTILIYKIKSYSPHSTIDERLYWVAGDNTAFVFGKPVIKDNEYVDVTDYVSFTVPAGSRIHARLVNDVDSASIHYDGNVTFFWHSICSPMK